MQTFLSSPDYREAARVLDVSRLGKQRSETLQILRALTDPTYGWQHHPAVSMWRGAESQLVCYGLAICIEWCERGYEDGCARLIMDIGRGLPTSPKPWWLGNPLLHSSHRSNLIRKDPVWYGQWGWKEDGGQAYWWPGPSGHLHTNLDNKETIQ